MKAILSLLLVVVCASMFGCERALPDNTHLSITPGIGISNVLTLGMTLDEAAQMRSDMKIEDFRDGNMLSVEVPSLGALWEHNSYTQPIYTIDFLVTSKDFADRPPRFCGRLDGRLSFATEGGVSVKDILDLYGLPMHVARPEMLVTTQDTWTLINNMGKWGVEGESYAIVSGPSDGNRLFCRLYYPGRGLTVSFMSNHVMAINVFTPSVRPAGH